ncbi:MAG: ASPIC/UnbV domain-containing protein, partial [Phycisphaerales bacterium JB059]
IGLDHDGISYNVSCADVDGDGDLDLLVQDVFGPLKLFINNEGSRRHWVRFRVVGENPNPNAIGAIVRCFVEGDLQVSEVLAGGNNYRTQNELVAHFWLDDACTVDSVGVQWMDGQQRTLSGYNADETWSLYPPSMLGDSNFDGEFTQSDLTDLLASVGPVHPGTEIHDMNGDGHIGAPDWNLLLARVGIER